MAEAGQCRRPSIRIVSRKFIRGIELHQLLAAAIPVSEPAAVWAVVVAYRGLDVQRLVADRREQRSEEHTPDLPSLMLIPYAVFCLNKQPTCLTSDPSCPNLYTS